MATPIRKLLAHDPEKVILMDGGMGTCTEDRGVDTRSTLWGSFALLSSEGRQINDAIHREFAEAGAQILIANTHYALRAFCNAFVDSYGSDRAAPAVGIAEGHSAGGRGAVLHAGLIESAVESARRAVRAGETKAVATCVGSFEGPYATESTMSASEIHERLTVEIALRQSVRSDLIIFETLTTREEMEGVALATCGGALATAGGRSDVAVGLTCGADGKTLAGVSMADAVTTLSQIEPAAWFIQCTRFDLVERALVALTDALEPGAVTGVYANDGRWWDSRQMKWKGERIEPERYASHALAWRAAGARIIGGCCGTTPEHIRQLKTILETAT